MHRDAVGTLTVLLHRAYDRPSALVDGDHLTGLRGTDQRDEHAVHAVFERVDHAEVVHGQDSPRLTATTAAVTLATVEEVAPCMHIVRSPTSERLAKENK